MKFEWWAAMDDGLKVIVSLLTLLGAFLGGGKLIRINRADVANTNVAIAGAGAEEAASNSVASEVARLSALVKLYGEKIEALTEQVQDLRDELGRVHNGRTTALKLLRKISLCGECDNKFGVLLETAITSLEEEDAPHESQPNQPVA